MWLVDIIKEFRRCRTCDVYKSLLDVSNDITEHYRNRIKELEVYSNSLATQIDILRSEIGRAANTNLKDLKPIGGIKTWRDLKKELESKHRKTNEEFEQEQLEKEAYWQGKAEKEKENA